MSRSISNCLLKATIVVGLVLAEYVETELDSTMTLGWEFSNTTETVDFTFKVKTI
mgnify:FL=1